MDKENVAKSLVSIFNRLGFQSVASENPILNRNLNKIGWLVKVTAQENDVRDVLASSGFIYDRQRKTWSRRGFGSFKIKSVGSSTIIFI